MMDALLVPLDGSVLAEQALVTAGDLASRTGAELHVVSVFQRLPELAASPDLQLADGTARARIREYLHDVADRVAAEWGITARRALLRGDIAEAVGDYVAATKIDLVVMTTHGRHGASRHWLGGTADRLIRSLPCPVLAYRPQPDAAAPTVGAGGPIVVPLDGSVEGDAAIEQAVALARLTTTPIALVHIVDPAPPAWTVMPPDLPIPSTAWLESRRLWATELLHELAAGLRARGLRAYATVRSAGSTAGAILAFAAQERASLIAVPTRRRGAAARLFLGSVADKLVRAAPMPVLVCRRAEREEPTRIAAAEASTLAAAGG